MLRTWVLIVFGETLNCDDICCRDCPATICPRMTRSRELSGEMESDATGLS